MLLKRATAITTAVLALLLLGGCGSESPATAPGPDLSPDHGDETVETENELSAAERAESCLPGIWVADHDSPFMEFWGEDADEFSGDYLVMFDDDGNFGVEYQQLRIYTELSDDPLVFVDVIHDGSSLGYYEVDSEGTVTTELVDLGANVHSVNQMVGGVEESDDPTGEPFPAFYQCESETLTAYPIADPDETEITFTLSERPA